MRLRYNLKNEHFIDTCICIRVLTYQDLPYLGHVRGCTHGQALLFNHLISRREGQKNSESSEQNVKYKSSNLENLEACHDEIEVAVDGPLQIPRCEWATWDHSPRG